MKLSKTLLPQLLLAAVFILGALSRVSADPYTPNSNSFGYLDVPFGGTGIPNDSVAFSTFTNTNGGITTLALTAHQRYANPALTNDGAGTFFAQPGGDILNGKPNYAMWNFGFYISGMGTGNTSRLYYDFDPAVGNDVTSYIDFGNFNFQDSWNDGMSFLGGANFDPNAVGQYNFGLVLLNSQGVELERSSISVNVGNVSVPDGGSTLAFMALALGGLAVIQRRAKGRKGSGDSHVLTGAAA